MLLLVRDLLPLTLLSLAIEKNPKNAPGNRSDCVELTEKRESNEVEGVVVVDSSKNIKRRFGSQPTTINVFKKDINFDDVSSNNEWIVAENYTPSRVLFI